jgi:hypothetical protein
MPTSNVPAQQRRVFRGRGGPKDGRLPPKKKKTLAVRYVADSKYPLPASSWPDDDKQDDDDHDGEIKEDDVASVSSANNKRRIDNSSGRNDDLVDAGAEYRNEEENGQEGAAAVAILLLEQEGEDKKETDDDEQSAMIELQHLRQRIQNIRNSMIMSKGKHGGKNHHSRVTPSLSSSSSSTSIQHYSANVLNAILNAVVEWHAIYTRYYYCYDDHPQSDDDSNAGPTVPSPSSLSDAPPPPPRPSAQVFVIREMGDLVFALIQQGLQCGPLAGAKPGYFKRCGSEIAGLVHAFLVRVVEYVPLSSSSSYGGCAFWSERQQSALALWMANAAKASATSATAHQEPSRSVQKKMLSGRR